MRVEVWIYSWMGDHARAVQMAERALDLGPRNPAPTDFGRRVRLRGEWSGIEPEILGKSLELSPANPLTRAWLAYNAAALGNADEALAQLQLVERLLGTTPRHCVSSGARLCLLAHRARRGRAAGVRRAPNALKGS